MTWGRLMGVPVFVRRDAAGGIVGRIGSSALVLRHSEINASLLFRLLFPCALLHVEY